MYARLRAALIGISALVGLDGRTTRRRTQQLLEDTSAPGPDWGPNFVECRLCDGAALSQAAMNEHLRVRHGDS